MNGDREHKLRQRIDELWDQRDQRDREIHRLKTRLYRMQKRLELWQKRARRDA